MQHWLLKLQPGVGQKQLRQAVQDRLGMDRYPQMFVYDPMPDAQSNPAVVILILLGASLLLCTGIGILNAFANRLSQREQQIGMLRAVGATRRQIRVIYGREALLLALITAPLALLLSLALAQLVLRYALQAPLSFPWWLLPVGLLFSLGVILLSAALPLRSASRLTPLAVLRNLPLMLKRQRLKVKSQRSFDPPRLLAGRAARFGHRSLTGISLLILLCMLTLSILCSIPYTLNLYSDPNVEPGAFSVYGNAFGSALFGGAVDVMRRDGGIQQADAEGLRSLPAVKRVSFTARQGLTLLKDHPSDYLTMEEAGALQAIYHEQEWRTWHSFTEEEVRRWLDSEITEYRDLQRRLHTEEDILSMQVLAVDAGRLQQLAPYVTEGAINLDRINRGEELLFMAPVRRLIRDKEGRLQNVAWAQQDKPVEQTLHNQDFRAGDRLDLRQLYIYPEDVPENHRQSDELWRKVHQERMTPTVGAVLTPDREQTRELTQLLRNMGAQLITTMEGMQALGIKHQGLSEVELFLSRDITPAEEQLIEQELKLVASRGADGQVHNRLAYARQSRRNNIQGIAVFVALLLVFFTLCQSLINNHLTGRLRAQRRAIGSLRALGADERALGKAYAHQLLRLMLTGVIPGIILSAAMAVQLGLLNWKPLDGSYFLLVATGEVLLVLLMYLLSHWHLRRRLHRLLSQPIIEQIREIG